MVDNQRSSSVVSPVGWTAYQLSNLGERAQISIVDQPSMYAKAWALFVTTLALRWWIGARALRSTCLFSDWQHALR